MKKILMEKIAKKNQIIESLQEEILTLRESIDNLEVRCGELQAELDDMYAKIKEFNTQQEATGGPCLPL